MTSTTSSTSSFDSSSFAQSVVSKCSGVTYTTAEDGTLVFTVPAENIREVVRLIRENVPLAFPESMFGVDLQDNKFLLIYYFWSHPARLLIQLRVKLEGEKPRIATVSDIFLGLEWHERETHEMFGIDFEGHPDLRPLLLPDELVGKYPLRKSFQPDRSRLEESGLPIPKPRPQQRKEEKSE